MDFDRKALLNALKIAEPALSAKDLLPLLQKLWFTGSVVQATDGTIGISAPCKTAFAGGIPGSVLIGFIESLGRDTLKAEVDSNKPDEVKAVTFICEGSRIKLPLEPAANNIWPFPTNNADPDGTLELDETWQQGLTFALISVTNNTTKDERRGVTLQPAKNTLNLYSTDGVTVAWASMAKPEQWEVDRICAPGEFVKETLRLMEKGGQLKVRNGSTIEAANEAGVQVHSRLIEVEEPTKYGQKIKEVLGDLELLPLPDGLKSALERAELLKDNKDGVPAKLTFVDKDLLVVEAKSSFGDLKEELYCEGAHELLTTNLTPAHVLRGLDGREAFAITKKCIVLSGPAHLTYMVAAYKGA